MHEGNGHHHNYDHKHEEDHAELDLERLKALIPYFLKHNEEHVEDLKKWHKQAMTSGFSDVAAEFRKIIRLSKKIDRRFKSAIKKLKKREY